MHNHGHGAGSAAADQAWGDGDQHTGAQQHKENCRHDQISLSQANLEEVLGDQVIKKAQNQCVNHNRHETRLTRCKLKGPFVAHGGALLRRAEVFKP